jgi:hypothetical protein
MPYPMKIMIGGNMNIPPRIANNLEGKTLQNQINPAEAPITIDEEGFFVQLNGKTGAVYK